MATVWRHARSVSIQAVIARCPVIKPCRRYGTSRPACRLAACADPAASAHLGYPRLEDAPDADRQEVPGRCGHRFQRNRSLIVMVKAGYYWARDCTFCPEFIFGVPPSGGSQHHRRPIMRKVTGWTVERFFISPAVSCWLRLTSSRSFICSTWFYHWTLARPGRPDFLGWFNSEDLLIDDHFMILLVTAPFVTLAVSGRIRARLPTCFPLPRRLRGMATLRKNLDAAGNGHAAGGRPGLGSTCSTRISA